MARDDNGCKDDSDFHQGFHCRVSLLVPAFWDGKKERFSVCNGYNTPFYFGLRFDESDSSCTSLEHFLSL